MFTCAGRSCESFYSHTYLTQVNYDRRSSVAITLQSIGSYWQIAWIQELRPVITTSRSLYPSISSRAWPTRKASCAPLSAPTLCIALVTVDLTVSGAIRAEER